MNHKAMRIFSVREIAELFDFGERYVRDCIESGLLFALPREDGDKYRVPDYALERWMRKTLEMPEERLMEVLRRLGANFKQLSLLEEVA